MREASVGYQCPECVREGAAQVRQPRTSFGGQLTSGNALVTMALIAINVVFFVVARATDGIQGEFVRRTALFTDIDLPRASLEGVAQGSYWQLVTSTFLHVDFLHIAFNMIGLWIFGSFLESQLGRWRYLALYLLTGLAGSVTIYLLFDGPGYSLGASGSVFGLFGAALVILLRQRRDVTQLLVLLALNLAITFTVPDVSWQAHIGGLVSGLAMGAGFAYAPRQHRTLVAAAMVTALALLCVALVALRTAALTG